MKETLEDLEITPADVKSRLDRGEKLLLVDVREPWEYELLRSLDAAAWLRFQGIEKARSLAGGIERWSLEVDPGVPRY